jgi:predicted NBD/HSP70 family sugar kinase
MPIQTDRVRAANRLAVYRALAAGTDLTRSELAVATQLSLPTVSSILGEFAAIGFVAGARLVLAVDLSGRRAVACLVDLRGEVVAAMDGPVLAPGVTPALLAWLAPIVRQAEAPIGRLALAVPGVVDPVDGHVDLAPALGWHDHAVVEVFETALGVGVVLENDVNALALAELHYGVGAAHRHVLYVAIGSGVGAGLVIDGRLYRGAHAAAGELGYSLPLCAASHRRRADAAPEPGAPRGAAAGPLERELLATARDCLDADGRLDLAPAGAAAAFDRFVDPLGPVLHNVACVLDPELLVVAWPADAEGRLAARLRDAWHGPWPLPIAAGELGAHGAARGVARLALERVEHDVCRTRRPGTGTGAPSTPARPKAAPRPRRTHA